MWQHVMTLTFHNMTTIIENSNQKKKNEWSKFPTFLKVLDFLDTIQGEKK